MASWDGKKLAKTNHMEVRCWCGMKNPTRTHMAWECLWFKEHIEKTRFLEPSPLKKSIGVNIVPDGMPDTTRREEDIAKGINDTIRLINKTKLHKGKLIIAT